MSWYLTSELPYTALGQHYRPEDARVVPSETVEKVDDIAHYKTKQTLNESDKQTPKNKAECKLSEHVDDIKISQENVISQGSGRYEWWKWNNNPELFIVICIIGASLGVIVEVINNKLHHIQTNTASQYPTKYWVYSAYHDVENEKGLLKHVHLVLNRVGYQKGSNRTDWNLLWSHDYPFRLLYPHLHRLKSHQRVNHFPGTGFITNKVDLATTELSNIPKAFKLPQHRDAFLNYAKANEGALFLQKHNQHRGVSLKNISSIDLSSGESFVQEYVQRPFLVDGHKFDIGVYVVLTSVNPLRVYWYKGDVLFRYCPAKYHPFDASDLDKYVIGDDYLPTWEVPSLAHPYTALGFSMKDSFDTYVRSQGKNPDVIWSGVQKAITEVFLNKEHHIVQALKNYPTADNFFELMRFDLVLDEDLNVYLLEANMSPNLSSAHYPPNQLLYEQVLYSLFSVTGVSSYLRRENIQPGDTAAAQSMITSQKNLATWGDACGGAECRSRCAGAGLAVCAVCRHCTPQHMRANLVRAHYEHLHRADFRRLYPPAMTPVSSPDEVDLTNLSEANQLQRLWYQGKCNADITWCT